MNKKPQVSKIESILNNAILSSIDDNEINDLGHAKDLLISLNSDYYDLMRDYFDLIDIYVEKTK